jgi:disulfide bond formation protein DsbB
MLPLDTFNQFLAFATLALGVVTVALLAAYLFRLEVGSFVATSGVWIALLAALGGIVGTLVHSELYGLPPCPLCWWQRIFLYPQAILFGLAIARRVSGETLRFVTDFSIGLSIVGLCIALYHHALQILPSGILPCPAEGSVSCGQILFLEFGFLTYPLMAAVLFAFLIILILFVRNSR